MIGGFCMDNIAFVIAVGKGVNTLDKTTMLIHSIFEINPKQEIYSFIAEEERREIPKKYIDFFNEETKVLYGNIPMKEYVFSVKPKAMIEAGKITKKELICFLDSDMLMLKQFGHLEEGTYVVPVDVGNVSWGRERARPYWEKLYSLTGIEMPKEKITSLVDKREMFPFFNSGFVISNKEFGKEWLSLTENVFRIVDDLDPYEGYSKKSRRRRFFKRIPYSHWIDQVALSLLSSKYKAKILDYKYNYPLNIMKKCPDDTILVHYHDVRNLFKLDKETLLSMDIDSYLKENNYNYFVSKMRMNVYDLMRKTKISLGKF